MAELGLQCRTRPYGGQGSYNTDGLAASNDANAVQPRDLLSSFEIREIKHRIRQLSPGVGSFMISPNTRTAEIRFG
jgi:hypothetical protein